MPHTKSAIKRARTSSVRRESNRATKKEIAGVRKQFFAAAAAGDKARSEELFAKFASVLDKAAKKKVIMLNNADRRKARAAARLAALKSA